jgi:hypothetical protein
MNEEKWKNLEIQLIDKILSKLSKSTKIDKEKLLSQLIQADSDDEKFLVGYSEQQSEKLKDTDVEVDDSLIEEDPSKRTSNR